MPLPYSPDFQTVTEHHDDAALSAVWARRLNEHDWQNFDLVLFSYHGLPIRQVIGASQQSACARSSQCANCSCLEVWNEANRLCYQASCMNTSRRIAQELGLPEDRWRMSFQSRLGRRWLQPYTIDLVRQLPKEGIEKVLVAQPSFAVDCLETIHEGGTLLREEFIQAGGREWQLVACPNDEPGWVADLSTKFGRMFEYNR